MRDEGCKRDGKQRQDSRKRAVSETGGRDRQRRKNDVFDRRVSGAGDRLVPWEVNE